MRWLRHITVSFIIVLLANGAMIATILTPEIAYTTYNTRQEPSLIQIEDKFSLTRNVLYDNVNYMILRERNSYDPYQLQATDMQGELLFKTVINGHNQSYPKLLVDDDIFIAYFNISNQIVIDQFNLQGQIKNKYTIPINGVNISYTYINYLYKFDNFLILHFYSHDAGLFPAYQLISYNLNNYVIKEIAQEERFYQIIEMNDKLYQIKIDYSYKLFNKLLIFEFVNNEGIQLELRRDVILEKNYSFYVLSLDKIVRFNRFIDDDDNYWTFNITDISTNRSIVWYKPNTIRNDRVYVLNQQLIMTYNEQNTWYNIPTATIIDVQDRYIGKNDLQLFQAQQYINYSIYDIQSDEKNLVVVIGMEENNRHVRNEILIYRNAKQPGLLLPTLHPVVQFNLIALILLTGYAVISYLRKEEKLIPKDLQYPKQEDL